MRWANMRALSRSEKVLQVANTLEKSVPARVAWAVLATKAMHAMEALRAKRGKRADAGQMTVELAVAMPILIIVAVVAINALQFVALCAEFDRTAHDAVRICAAAPAYRQTIGQSRALVEERLRSLYRDQGDASISVSHRMTGLDYDEFTVTLEMSPTLFGRGVRSEVFGVAMPRLKHETKCVVDVYKPGVVI